MTYNEKEAYVDAFCDKTKCRHCFLQGEECNENNIEKLYELIRDYETCHIVIPDNATNGDIIKALFPQMGVNEDWKATRSGQILSKDKKYVDISFACTSDWWNTLYKRETE